MNENRERLNRVLDRVDAVALAFGTMIGWGWVVLSGAWVAEAGVLGAILAFCVGAVLFILVGMIYAELTTALPLAGAEMIYTYRGLGFQWSWFAGWTIAFAYLSIAAWESIALSTALNHMFPLPQIGYMGEIAGYPIYLSWVAIGSIGALAMTIINYFGAKPAAVFQVMITGGLIVVGLMFLFGGISFGNVAYAEPLFTDKTGFVMVLLIVPSMLIGFDVVPNSVEDMNIPPKSISRILIFSIALAALWYILIIVAISLSAPQEVRTAGLIPAADAMAYAYSYSLFSNILIVGGICGILTSWNGFIVGVTRIIFAMGRAKMLPPVFGKLHPKYKTPTAAILLTGLICMVTPFLGKNALPWFVNTSSFASVVSYFLVVVAFLALRRKEPSLVRPYKVRAGILVGVLAVAISGFFLIMYMPLGSLLPIPAAVDLGHWKHEIIIIASWFVLGLVFIVYTRYRYPAVSPEERELLIFGEEYARKEVLHED